MSLRLSNYDGWVEAGERISYLEVRLGEQYNIPFTVQEWDGTTGTIWDISLWTWTTSSEVFSASCTYNGEGRMISITDIEPQLPITTPADLIITDIDGPAGTGVLQIPASVNPDPNRLIFPDTANTMLNLITLTATYPSSSVGFNNIRKILIGLLVRLG